MAERHYLLKVLGLSGIPKLLTFGITLISFPLLMRSLGSSEYGVVIFIGSTFALFEVLIDLGVSSASGKAVAAVRTHQPEFVRDEFLVWAKLQLSVTLSGFVPMLLLVQFMIESSPSFQNVAVLWVMAAAMMFSMFLNFLRINLNSLLAFRSLAILDTTQSLVTSGGYFIVAFWVPSALGLAIAGLVTSLSALCLASLLLALRLSKSSTESAASAGAVDTLWSGRHDSNLSRLKESANFLWLRLSTRVFQEGPVIIIGRLLGPEVVGVIGAFRKIAEIASTPYLVIGNALMVRVHEVSMKGAQALKSYWEAVVRIGSTALIFCALTFLLADPVSQALLPDSERAAELFGILSPLVVTSALFGMLAPMSDYKGGLTMRNTLLTTTAGVQLVLLWLANMLAGEVGLVSMFVMVNLCLVVGYACISHKVLFASFRPILHREIYKFAAAIVVSCGAVTLLKRAFSASLIGPETDAGLISAVVGSVTFLLIVVLLLQLSGTWRFYFNRNFFEFSET